jgi:hypothetical protein
VPSVQTVAHVKFHTIPDVTSANGAGQKAQIKRHICAHKTAHANAHIMAPIRTHINAHVTNETLNTQADKNSRLVCLSKSGKMAGKSRGRVAHVKQLKEREKETSLKQHTVLTLSSIHTTWKDLESGDPGDGLLGKRLSNGAATEPN